MKVKLRRLDGVNTYVPKIKIALEDGTLISNDKLPLKEQITVEYTIANRRQRDRYLSYSGRQDGGRKSKNMSYTTTSDYEGALSDHITKITGLLEEHGIKDGVTLYKNHTLCQETMDLVGELFDLVMGSNKTAEEDNSEGET